MSSQAAEKAAAKKSYLMFVGTYTTKTTSKGIYVFRYDASSGKLAPLGVAAETPDPSWVVIHPSGKYLYAANEAGKNSTISAFAVDAPGGKLTLLNQLPALGEDPCYLSFDKTGKYLFVANYTSGNVVVFPIGADGKLGAATANVHDEGTLGPNKERQEAPHSHWTQASTDNRFVFVADLGLDAILAYYLDFTKGTLTPNKPFFLRPLTAGAGPRHATFSQEGRYFYVLSEMDSTVTSFAYSPGHGVFGYLGVVHMLPVGFEGRNDAAEIAIHPNGKFLYASNRGHDSIAAFHIDAASGELTAVGDFSVLGKEPRHFAIDPSGKFLLAEDQFSDKIVTFSIDQKTGALTPTGDAAEVPSPVCLVFLPVD
ncbi:MAG TPA: lactonase family protein [Methylomirabilota bacterium]|nr:lactonase family protein [Methylomirabilota bacterium]